MMEDFHKAVHEDIVTCAVCDCFCPDSEGHYLLTAELPSGLFYVLREPTGIDGDAPVLHPQLVSYYNISVLMGDLRFRGILLSTRGVRKHKGNCELETSCKCVPKLFICEKFGCLAALKRKSVPRFAIANGNWIGKLPELVHKYLMANVLKY